MAAVFLGNDVREILFRNSRAPNADARPLVAVGIVFVRSEAIPDEILQRGRQFKAHCEARNVVEFFGNGELVTEDD